MIRVIRIGIHVIEVEWPRRDVCIRRNEAPGIALVVGAIKSLLRFRVDQRIDAIAIVCRHRQANAAHHALGHALVARDVLPGIATITRSPDTAVRPACLGTPGLALEFPERGKQQVRIVGTHDQIDRAGPFVLEQYTFPGLTTVLRAKDALLVVGTERVAHRRDINDVRVMGMYSDTRDVQ